MKAVSVALLNVALLVAGVAAQSNFTINTPIEPGSSPSATPLQEYAGLTGTSFTWPTNVTQGTSVGLTLHDSNGLTAQSAAFTINPGPSNSCLSASAGGSSSTSAGSSSSAGASSSSAPTSSAPASSSAASSSSASHVSSTVSGSSSHASSSASGSSSAPSPSGSTSGNSSGAVANLASMGLAGVVGAVVAAVLA
ncbi:hypothetical protein AcV5_008635 [Taiwanofungus camphoratus]|nr:hypothetical protein AcV5_008635 [Antrodia cinnamomea]